MFLFIFIPKRILKRLFLKGSKGRRDVRFRAECVPTTLCFFPALLECCKKHAATSLILVVLGVLIVRRPLVFRVPKKQSYKYGSLVYNFDFRWP